MKEEVFSNYCDDSIKKAWDKPHSAEEWNKLVEEHKVALDYIKQYQLEVQSLKKEAIRYKLAWNMAEDELEKWKKDLHLQSHVLGFMEGKAAQTEEYMMLQQPLSDEEIEELREYHGINDWLYETSVTDFARAIEERHGIK